MSFLIHSKDTTGFKMGIIITECIDAANYLNSRSSLVPIEHVIYYCMWMTKLGCKQLEFSVFQEPLGIIFVVHCNAVHCNGSVAILRLNRNTDPIRGTILLIYRNKKFHVNRVKSFDSYKCNSVPSLAVADFQSRLKDIAVCASRPLLNINMRFGPFN